MIDIELTNERRGSMSQGTVIFEWGKREKETIVFLHGLGSTGLTFGELASYLPEYHIVSFHLPGHGGRDPFERETSYRPTEMVAEIDRYINEVGVKGFYLAGHSWGAHLALYYATERPDLVKGILLLDGGYLSFEEESLESELDMVEKFYEELRFSSEDEFLQSEQEELGRWSEDLKKAALSQVTERNGEVRLATSIFTAQSVIKGMYAEPTMDVFSKVSLPVLLLRGTVPEEMEEIRSSAVREMKKAVPQLESCAIKDAGHELYRNNPEQVAYEIKGWICCGKKKSH